jgi:hypothetical protein
MGIATTRFESAMRTRRPPMIRPYAPAPADRYCRLFPEAPSGTQKKMTREALENLSGSMRSNCTPIPPEIIPGRAPPPIAVTYFGQFVDHDLTLNSTPLREAGSCEPIYTINHRTPWLDMDHLYGDGPRSSRHSHLYEPDGVSFRVGPNPGGGESFDIPFTNGGQPAVADERNGENIIIRQIHAMFLKLHNAAVRELPPTLPSCERFDRARDRVRWQYQWLVHNWYLPEICHPDVYEEVINKGNRRIDWQKDGFSIPVEFAVAAFRFGHSMVRRGYKLNSLPLEKGGSGFVPLADLFSVKNKGSLDSRLKIDWTLLSKDTAMSIDTAVVEPLFDLPNEIVNLFVRTPKPPSENALPFRTLLRGAAMRLPTGQQVRDAFGEAAIASTPPEYKLDPWGVLRSDSVGLAEETPLWYYVLLEAQLDPGRSISTGRKIGGVGATLGRLGSRIVAEVIEGSLLLDPTSFLRRKPSGWKPESWTTTDRKQIEVTSLKDVACVAAV